MTEFLFYLAIYLAVFAIAIWFATEYIARKLEEKVPVKKPKVNKHLKRAGPEKGYYKFEPEIENLIQNHILNANDLASFVAYMKAELAPKQRIHLMSISFIVQDVKENRTFATEPMVFQVAQKT